MIKPNYLGDPSLGNFIVLCCPKCDKPILFPSCSIEDKNFPSHCEYCKEMFDWTGVEL